MGLDYFLPESWREKANEKAKAFFSGVQESADSDLKSAFLYLKSQTLKIVTSLIMVALSFAMLKLGSSSLIKEYPVFLALWSIASMLLFSGGFLTLFHIFMDILTPVGVGGFFRAITTFIVSSPKGPLAAIGFICLCISFSLRYNFLATV